MKTLSIRQVNRLYLISLVLVITIGSLMQMVSFSWGLIGTELFLILLPTVWMLRKNQIPIKESLFLKKPRASVGLVALMLGGGAWMVDSVLETYLIQLTGYTAMTGVNILPKTLLEGVVLFLAFAVAAPICEEVLFRGTIQHAYQQEKNGFAAIMIAGLMFVVYHLRFQGFLALIPIALILGYLYWRTRSLYASMLAHFANNALAVILILQASFFPQFELPFPSVTAAAFGFLLIVVGLFLLNRLLPNMPAQTRDDVEPVVPSKPFRTYWPLFVAGLIFAIFAVVEVVTGRVFGKLKLDSALLPQQAAWNYEIRHKGDEVVGEAQCSLQQLNLAVTLDCTRMNEAFELQVNNSFFSSLAMETILHVVWNQEDLSIYQLEQINQAENFLSRFEILPESDGSVLSVTQNGSTQAQDFDPNTLFEDEWAWRLMATPFQDNLILQTSYLEPLMWREETKDSGPVLQKTSFLMVMGKEQVDVPAGSFEAWKVNLNNSLTAWYAVEEPHFLIKFDSRMFDYALTEMTITQP